MRFSLDNRVYDLIGREVFFGIIHVGTLPGEVHPRTPEEAAQAVKAWRAPNANKSKVVRLSDYRASSFKQRH